MYGLMKSSMGGEKNIHALLFKGVDCLCALFSGGEFAEHGGGNSEGAKAFLVAFKVL